jgi:4-amino-4-deoxy-L-arabinose transferase-like glycosyltransferase
MDASARSPSLSARGALHVWLLLAFITSAALAIRLFGLTGYGLWFDEAYHMALVRLPTTGDMLAGILANPPSDPLYALLLRGWAAVFGTSDAAVRSMSVVFGTLTVPATFALGLVLAGRAAGLLGATLVTVSPSAVEFSQEAALYALAALLTTVSLALGFRWQRTGKGGLAYVLIAAFAVYSHYVVPVVLTMVAAGAMLPHFRHASLVPPRHDWLATSIALALWLPWLVLLVQSWANSEAPRAGLPQDLTGGHVLGALGQYAAGTAALLAGDRLLLAAGVCAAAVLLAVAWWRSGVRARRHARLLIVVSAVVFAAPALAALLTGRWLFVPHFMLFLLPALSAVAGAGVVWGIRETARPAIVRASRWLPAIALGTLATVHVLGLWKFYAQPPHGADGLRELAAVLRGEAQPGEPVFVTPPLLFPSLDHYVDREIVALPEDFDLHRVYPPYDGQDWRRRSLARVLERTDRVERFWLVYRPELDEGGGLLQELTGRFNVTRTLTYEFGTLYTFEAR